MLQTELTNSDFLSNLSKWNRIRACMKMMALEVRSTNCALLLVFYMASFIYVFLGNFQLSYARRWIRRRQSWFHMATNYLKYGQSLLSYFYLRENLVLLMTILSISQYFLSRINSYKIIPPVTSQNKLNCICPSPSSPLTLITFVLQLLIKVAMIFIDVFAISKNWQFDSLIPTIGIAKSSYYIFQNSLRALPIQKSLICCKESGLDDW